MKEETPIEHIRELWVQSNDADILRAVQAAIDDIEGYPPEVRGIITEEAVRRQLIEIGASGEPVTTEKGRVVLHETKGSSPQTFLSNVGKSFLAFGAVAILALLLELCGVKTRIETGGPLCLLGAVWLLQIWKKKPVPCNAPAKEDIVHNRRHE